MMKYSLLITWILLLGNACFAQIQVSGKVFDNSGEPLPGVTILEKGNEGGFMSNFHGEFSIKCISEKPILLFTFGGMEDKKIVIEKDTILNIILVEDTTLLQEVISTGFKRRYNIGLNTGVNHNQLGIETHNLIPRLLPFYNYLSTNFKWRFLTKNQYLKAEIGRYRTLHIGNQSHLALKASYQQISLENTNFSNRQFSISTTIEIKRWKTSIGYARREIKNHEDLTNSQNGVSFGLQKRFLRRLNFKANTIYWSDDWQYNVHLDANIPKTRINLGLGYEKINDWEEFGVSVLYLFYY